MRLLLICMLDIIVIVRHISFNYIKLLPAKRRANNLGGVCLMYTYVRVYVCLSVCMYVIRQLFSGAFDVESSFFDPRVHLEKHTGQVRT